MNIFEYAGVYIKHGIICIFDGSSLSDDDKWSNSGECSGSWFYVILYTVSLFVIQLNLNSIIHHKFTRSAQYVFAFMVPLTLLGFLLAEQIVDIDPANSHFTKWDILGLIITGIGVFVFNLFQEKEQRASIEEDE
jgi:hypothetical protein